MRLLDEGTAEPRGAHLRRRSVLLEQLGLREQLAPSGTALRDLTEDRDGALFLLRDESAERAEPGEILVPRRKVPEQVADRPDAEPLEQLRRFGADPGEPDGGQVERATRMLAHARRGFGHPMNMVPETITSASGDRNYTC